MSLFVSTKIRLASGEETTVYYLTEQGKKILEGLLASDKYTQARFETVFERLNKMQDELVRTVFLENMQTRIVESLRLRPNQTRQQIASNLPDFTKNPMVWHAFYEAWRLFEKAGVIVPTSHGRGHPRTWQLSLKKEVEMQ